MWSFIHAQFDPDAMAKFSKLSPNQRQQLINQYQAGGGLLPQSAPTVQLPNTSIEVAKPDQESFDARSDFLEGS